MRTTELEYYIIITEADRTSQVPIWPLTVDSHDCNSEQSTSGTSLVIDHVEGNYYPEDWHSNVPG